MQLSSNSIWAHKYVIYSQQPLQKAECLLVSQVFIVGSDKILKWYLCMFVVLYVLHHALLRLQTVLGHILFYVVSPQYLHDLPELVGVIVSPEHH